MSRFSLCELKAMASESDIGCPLRIIVLVEGYGRGDAAPSERPRMIIWLLHVTASYTTEGVARPS